jgi:DNA processing protein
MAEHGSAAAALDALPEVARAAGVAEYRPCPAELAEAELAAARLAGATMVALGSPAYPAALASLTDAPPLLWALGDTDLLARPAVALVGARNASSLGTRMARSLAGDLGKAGFAVASGLARGIDAAAHIAALDTGTIAVMAGGVDVAYPAENAVLAQEILDRGLRISEQPMGLQPQARHFPRRNRIISGIARAVVVVEAAAKSGSLITARDAADQGREVMAVPGHPFDPRAAGCNMLLRDGATLVRGSRDVLEALGPALPATEPAAETAQAALPLPAEDTLPERGGLNRRSNGADRGAERGAAAGTAPQVPQAPRRAPDLRAVAALHRQILDRLGAAPMAEDQLIRDLGLAAATVGPELVSLELEGRIERRAGGLLSRLN